jgi:CRP-like cAMP-binding protein
VLAQVSIFRDLDSEALLDLARRTGVREFRSGALIVAQGDPGDTLYIIHGGRVKVTLIRENGREVIVSILKPGDFFGEMSLFDGRPRSASVVALEPATLLVLGRDSFVSHLRSRPQTAFNMLRELSGRLRHADDVIANLALHDVNARLAWALTGMARTDGEVQNEGLLLRRRPTQQDLASMVGSCRETISRAYAHLVRRGHLIPRGRGVVLTPRFLEMARDRSA